MMNLAFQVGLRGALSHLTGVSNAKAAALQNGISSVVTPVVTNALAMVALSFSFFPEKRSLNQIDVNEELITGFVRESIGVVGLNTGILIVGGIAGMYVGKKVCEELDLPITDRELMKLDLMCSIVNLVTSRFFK